MRKIIHRIKTFRTYMKDRQVPLYKKLLIIAGFLYLLFPVDIVPDFIIGIGIIDDAAVLVFLWNAIRTEIDGYINQLERMQYDESKVVELDSKRKAK